MMVAYSFNKRFIVPISMGLGIHYALDDIHDLNGTPKRQTIREVGKRRHARAGDMLQLYTGMRTKNCRLIGTAICTEVKRIVLYFDPNGMTALVGEKMYGPRKMKQFAQADGFASVKDMHDFWMVEHGMQAKWSGVVIYWHPIST